jgi:hypothetical protein
VDDKLRQSVIAPLPSWGCLAGCDGRIVDTNPALKELSGRDGREEGGLPLSSLPRKKISWSMHSLFWAAALRRALLQGVATHLSTPVGFRPAPGDPLVAVEGTAAPWLGAAGERVGVVVLGIDTLTDALRTEPQSYPEAAEPRWSFVSVPRADSLEERRDGPWPPPS